MKKLLLACLLLSCSAPLAFAMDGTDEKQEIVDNTEKDFDSKNTEKNSSFEEKTGGKIKKEDSLGDPDEPSGPGVPGKLRIGLKAAAATGCFAASALYFKELVTSLKNNKKESDSEIGICKKCKNVLYNLVSDSDNRILALAGITTFAIGTGLSYSSYKDFRSYRGRFYFEEE